MNVTGNIFFFLIFNRYKKNIFITNSLSHDNITTVLLVILKEKTNCLKMFKLL